MLYRKRLEQPFEAIQFTGDNIQECREFVERNGGEFKSANVNQNSKYDEFIFTCHKRGVNLLARNGDYIAMNETGNNTLCTIGKSAFEETFEPAEDYGQVSDHELDCEHPDVVLNTKEAQELASSIANMFKSEPGNVEFEIHGVYDASLKKVLLYKVERVFNLW